MASIRPLKSLNAGVPNAPFGTVNIYLAGTVTPATLYADSGGITTVANPTQLDANGRLHVYVADGYYDVTVTLGTVTFTVLNVEHVSVGMFVPVAARTGAWQLIEAGDTKYLAWNFRSTDGVNANLQNTALPGRAIKYGSDGSMTWVYQAPTGSAFALASMRTDMTLSSAGALTGVFTTPAAPTLTMATPVISSATPSASGGTLATGTYYYKVTALDGAGGETAGSTESSAAVTGPTGSVALAWAAITGAFAYNVYRGTTAGAENVKFLVFGTSFTDTGTAGTSATPPGSTTSYTVQLAQAGPSWVLGGNFGVGTSRPQRGFTVGPGGEAAVEIGLVGPPGLVATTTGGTLASGTYYYVVTAIDTDGGETRAGPEASVTVTGPQGKVTLSWSSPTGGAAAVSYRIYRGTAIGAENTYYTSSTTGFVDTGAAGTAASPPTSTTAYVVRFLSGTGVRTPTVGPSVAQQHTLPVVTSDTIVLLAAAQTLSNKTLAAPVVTGGVTVGGGLTLTGVLLLTEAAAPGTPAAGLASLYFAPGTVSGWKLAFKVPSGTEYIVLDNAT